MTALQLLVNIPSDIGIGQWPRVGPILKSRLLIFTGDRKNCRAREQFADPWRVMAVWGLSALGGVGPISSAGLRTNPTLIAGHSI
jgi:hypothetical protein